MIRVSVLSVILLPWTVIIDVLAVASANSLGDAFTNLSVSETEEWTVNNWQPPFLLMPMAKNVPKPTMGTQAAVYRRMFVQDGQEQWDFTRVLVTGGYADSETLRRGSWSYTPITNSWFHIAVDKELVDRTGHSLVTLCRTNVLLFGGYQDQKRRVLGDTWIFDGVLEEWRRLIANSTLAFKFIRRAFHSAATLQRLKSPCSCQDSMFVYGGFQAKDARDISLVPLGIVLGDLIELRCIGEKHNELIYTWIFHHSGELHPPTLWMHFAVNVNSTCMFVYGGSRDEQLHDNRGVQRFKDAWLYNIDAGVWKLVSVNDSNWLQSPVKYMGSAVFHDKLDMILHVVGSVLYTMDMHTLTWERVIPASDESKSAPEHNMLGLSAVIVDNETMVFSGIVIDHDLSVTKVWRLSFMDSSNWVWFERPPPEESPPGNGKTDFQFSVQVGLHVFIPTVTETAMPPVLFHQDKLYRQILETFHRSDVYECHYHEDKIWNQFLLKLWMRVFYELLIRRAIVSTEINKNKLPALMVWQLDLSTNTWWQYSTLGSRDCFLINAMAAWGATDVVTYGFTTGKKGSLSQSLSPFQLLYPVSSVCVFDVKQRRWIETNKLVSKQIPTFRFAPALVEVANGAIVMFGGATCSPQSILKFSRLSIKALRKRKLYEGGVNVSETLVNSSVCTLSNEIWILDISKDSHRHRPNLEVSWRRVGTRNSTNSQRNAAGRIGHTLLAANSKLFVVGGTDSVFSNPSLDNLCCKDLRYFDFQSLEWHELRQSGFELTGRLHPASFCRIRATVIGEKIVAIAQRKEESFYEYACRYEFQSEYIVSFFFDDYTWIKQSNEIPFSADDLYTLAGKLFATGSLGIKPKEYVLVPVYFESKAKQGLSVMLPGCYSGQFSANWSREACEPCPVGFFARSGSSSCTKCPEGLTTTGEGASELLSCVCEEHYCGSSGNCFVANDGNQLGARCNCELGYAGSRCQYPIYFIIGGVSVAGLLIVVFLVVFIQKTAKYRRLKRAKEDELEEMNRAWNIKLSELHLIQRIDTETRGSYGDIYKALYRNLQVAVKKLKVVLRECREEREFEREIVLMRSVRHKNIVLFLGAGRSDNDGCPFLVVEYMERGALCGILYNKSIPLSQTQRLLFCLDAARGMEFLHSLRPPRIHRDIKSSNLLVSHDWIVKVADFGSARLVKSQGVRQAVAPSRNIFVQRQENLTEPLLKSTGVMSRNPGALFWRAPEIFSGEPYGTSADVFSFGIVMWEVVAREMPYNEKKFEWIQEIEDAVLQGTRPSVPLGCASDGYLQLMRHCWSKNPELRPSFAVVVTELNSMLTGNQKDGTEGNSLKETSL